MVEVEMLNQFVNQLAMCELLSAHNLLQPSLAFDCKQIEVFIQESYFDNNYNAFIKWWDATIVPVVTELQSLVGKQIS
jgi:hypothetical protein|tara:strand:+ start:44 stop:277 length:234 start_codon:yes stop_codon:yes gene_type:complete